MAGTVGKIRGVSSSNSAQAVYGLVYGNAGTLITQASIQSITYTVTRADAGGAQTVTGTGSLTVASCVFDAPVSNDPRASSSYNFLGIIPHTCFAVRGRQHVVDIDLVPVTGEPFRQVYESTPV